MGIVVALDVHRNQITYKTSDVLEHVGKPALTASAPLAVAAGGASSAARPRPTHVRNSQSTPSR